MESNPKKLIEETERFRTNHVLCFGLKNPRLRYFIPLQDSTFGGLVVKSIMFDSGCNTILPFPNLLVLQNLFGVSFSWAIHKSNSVSGEMLNLYIKGIDPIECKIQKKIIYVEHLRFHIDSSACLLLKECSQIALEYHHLLDEFSLSGIEIKPRTHALLGQDILHHYVIVQTKDCVAVIHNSDFIPSFKYLNFVLQQEGVNGVSTWREEFSDSKDDDHDGDDCYTMIDSPRDDYEF